MDKYEFNIKVEQIKKNVNRGDYVTAMKIADTIDWRRVRNTNLLSMVADIYDRNEEYGEAKDILLMAFERAPIGKRLLYKLAELALKEGNITEAEAYYREFCDLVQDDPRQNLLRYLILKAKGAPIEQLIHSLESYTTIELDEKWLYELASLYHQAGKGEECVKICDRIMLMFGLGKYVDRAMELKLQHAPLTSYQMDLVENRDKYEAKLRAVEQAYNGGRGSAEDDYDEGDQQDAVRFTEDVGEDSQSGEVNEEGTARARTDSSMDAEIAARMKEVEVEEKLAQEMSMISDDEFPTEEDPAQQTRILTNIRTIMPNMEKLSEDTDNGEEVSILERQITLEEAMDSISVQEDFQAAEGLAAIEAEDDHQGENSCDESVDLEIEDLDLEEPDAWTTNHLMIEASTPQIGLETALEALRQIHRELGTKNPVVKIAGYKLDKRGILAVVDKIAGKDLIVEGAGALSPKTLQELDQVMASDESGMIVVLIDNPGHMEAIHRQNPTLAQKFEFIGSDEREMEDLSEAIQMQADLRENKSSEPVQIQPRQQESAASAGQVARLSDRREAEPNQDLSAEEQLAYETDVEFKRSVEKKTANQAESPAAPAEPEYDDGAELDIDEFAQYACKYASDIDCSITGKSMLALYERIEIMEEDGVLLTRENAEKLIEEAADRAEKPSIGKLITGVFSSKYNKDGLLILKEEHFI